MDGKLLRRPVRAGVLVVGQHGDTLGFHLGEEVRTVPFPVDDDGEQRLTRVPLPSDRDVAPRFLAGMRWKYWAAIGVILLVVLPIGFASLQAYQKARI